MSYDADLYTRILNNDPLLTLNQLQNSVDGNMATMESKRSKQIRQSLRESLISSDSHEQRKMQNGKIVPPEIKKTYMMNRLNWITYLKILYDQLEKSQQPEIPDKNSAISSFLSSHSLRVNPKNQRIIERVERESFVRALQKIMDMLPLLS